MVVVLEQHATEPDVERIIKVLHDYGFDVHRSTGINQTVLGAIGVKPDFDTRQLELLPGVAPVYRITDPFKLASRHIPSRELGFRYQRSEDRGKGSCCHGGTLSDRK